MNLLSPHLLGLESKLLEDLMISPMCKGVRIYAFRGDEESTRERERRFTFRIPSALKFQV